MTGEVVWRRLIGRGLLLAVVGLAASVLLLMAWSSMRWDAALRESVVPLDRLAQSRYHASEAQVFTGRLLRGDRSVSVELVLASLQRARHAGRSIIEPETALAGMSLGRTPSEKLMRSVGEYLAALDQVTAEVETRVRLTAAEGLSLRQIHAPLQQASLAVERVLLAELAHRRATLREIDMLNTLLVAALALLLILLRYRADVLETTAKREQERSDQRIRLHARALEGTRDGVMVTDAAERILSVNRAFLNITGYTEDALIGASSHVLRSGHHDAAFYRAMRAALVRDGHWQGEVWCRLRNGEMCPQWVSVSAVDDDDGRTSHYVAVFTDMSQVHQFEARVEHLAQYDPLTDLPNRLLIGHRLAHSIEAARRDGTGVAVLFIDLDRFKHINDALGHDCGDLLLTEVARRLQGRIRREDTLGRYGADEFVLLIEQVHDASEAATVARDILAMFNEPFALSNGEVLYAKASIGISVYPGDGETAAELLRDADAAMDRAKRDGRSIFRYYSEDLTRAANTRLALESRLRRALDEGGFRMHYQPLVCLRTGRVLGAEALVRLTVTDGPPIGPGEFIPVMEDNGMIVELGRWVQREVCRQGKAWLDAGYQFDLLAVNLSPEEVRRGGVVEQLRDVLAETGFPPERFEIEITESGLMQRGEDAVEFMHQLKSLGIRLAIDDFGTGYSSLSYLKRFPVNKLKIDRSFIMALPQDQSDAQLTTTIIELARNLGLRVLAEGVETAEQQRFLAARGCDVYQGYLCSPPVPPERFEQAFLASPRAAATG